MKNYIFTLVFFAAALLTVDANAQTKIRKSSKPADEYPYPHDIPKPHFSVRPIKAPTQVSYDGSTTVFTVNFPQNSNGGTVEVLRNGAKVAGITAGGGTTFSCRLKDYGVGDYNIIVSRDNTVVYSKNITVR